MQKSSIKQIEQRFDGDVERFSQIETGQQALPDARLMLDLIAGASAAAVPQARDVLDLGCGAGNYTLRLLQQLPDLNCTLVDLSTPMLDRAVERVTPATSGQISVVKGDLRELDFGCNQFDIIMSGACLHHLRDETEWTMTFEKLHDALRPGGCLWISDLICHTIPAIQKYMWCRYGDYLVELRDEAYRDEVFAYIELEDSPRPLIWQLARLRDAGFDQVEVLHLNTIAAVYGGLKKS